MNPKILLCLILLPFPAGAAQRLTLTEAKRLAADGPRVRSAEASAEEARAGAASARGAFYPAVNASVGFTRTDDAVGVFGAKLRQEEFTNADFALPALNDPDGWNHWATRFEVVQPLLHSTVDWKTREGAERSSRAAELRREFRVQEAKLLAVEAYLKAAAFRERSGILEEGILSLQKLEDGYQLMSAPTAATTTSYLIAQTVRLGLAAQKSGVTTAEANVLRGLKSLLGLPASEEIVLLDPIPAVVDPGDAGTGAPRADVRAASEEASAARALLGAAKGDWGPRLDLIGGYNLYTGDFESLGTAYDVSALLTWPLFRGPRMGRIDAAAGRSRAVEENARAARLEAEAALESGRADVRARIAELALVGEAEKRAAEAIRISRRRYAEGTLPLFNYSESIQNWVAARQELVEARRRAAEADARLSFERGAL